MLNIVGKLTGDPINILPIECSFVLESHEEIEQRCVALLVEELGLRNDLVLECFLSNRARPGFPSCFTKY